MGHREVNAPSVRRVVRDADYSWGTSAMMNLYSGTTDPFSHRCRIVLYEKQMDFQVIDVDLFNKPEDIAVINPYNRVPVLVDRDLMVYALKAGYGRKGARIGSRPGEAELFRDDMLAFWTGLFRRAD